MGSGGSGGSGAGRGEGAQGADRVPDPALEVRSDLPVEESLVTAMREALDLGTSLAGGSEGLGVLGGRPDIPIGALVLAADGAVIGRGVNRRESDHDPSGHAEIVALREAGIARGGWRLSGCTLLVTLEPCAMCAGAAVNARLGRLVYGAHDPKAGAVTSHFGLLDSDVLNHRVAVTSGVSADDAGELLRSFFRERRANNDR